MQQRTYDQELLRIKQVVSLHDLITLEEELMDYLLNGAGSQTLSETIKQQYNLLSRTIVHHLDEEFKNMLVDFFSTTGLPAYLLVTKNDGIYHTSEFMLQHLERPLQEGV